MSNGLTKEELQEGYDIKVDQNVPVPPDVQYGGERRSKYPFRIMDVGDSFFIPNLSDVKIKSMHRTVSSWNRRKESKQHGKRWACRQVRGGVRVWRIQ